MEIPLYFVPVKHHFLQCLLALCAISCFEKQDVLVSTGDPGSRDCAQLRIWGSPHCGAWQGQAGASYFPGLLQYFCLLLCEGALKLCLLRPPHCFSICYILIQTPWVFKSPLWKMIWPIEHFSRGSEHILALLAFGRRGFENWSLREVPDGANGHQAAGVPPFGYFLSKKRQSRQLRGRELPGFSFLSLHSFIYFFLLVCLDSKCL